ncbi:uncharacterized domain 1-containing protein [Roseivivax lentus]|uniref:Uncharacterized domain 1-containing protein n=1 Tax=Roseivivax lentus TaxID=633194 RepID=A0A1N7MAQ6_9RHOB|nr:PaaI family thioesterase [Roseivivax lentus]SIS83196.1 uncharacterized domain 1-containing protein [Roseivivax lentus]
MAEDFPEAPYPFQQHLGMERTGWSADYAQIELPLAEHLGNRQGLPHGGVHATLLDTAMGYAGTWTGDADAPQMALTLSLNVQYLSRPRGARLIAEGWRTGGGKSTFFAEGVIRDDEGEIIAKGSGVFRYRKG